MKIENLLKEGYEYLAREEYYTYLFKYYSSNKEVYVKTFDRNGNLNGELYLDKLEVTKLINKFN